MIGITFALPSESSDLQRRIAPSRRDGELLIGKIDNHEVVLVHTGVGAKHCNARLELLLHRTRPRLLISSGFAGAVSSQLHTGDLILAENFSDPHLLARAGQALRDRSARRVKLFTSTSIVDSITERNEIATAAGAAAVDMETGAIANVCQVHGTTLLSLRVISDTPDEPFPTPPAVLFDIERQRTNYSRLAAYLLRHPASIAELTRFSKRIAHAREGLTAAIIDLLNAL